MPSQKILTQTDIEIAKKNLEWRCPVGKDPTYCPNGCILRPLPCFEFKNKTTYKCPHWNRWSKYFHGGPHLTEQEEITDEYLEKVTKYHKTLAEYESHRDEEWKILEENCRECEAVKERDLNPDYTNECSAYRRALWIKYLLNNNQVEIWNNGLR